MKVKTSELSGKALDWAVAKCEQATGKNIREGFGGSLLVVDEHDFGAPARYSTDWSQGGPIIEREKLSVGTRHTNEHIYWDADVLCWARNSIGGFLKYGSTPLVAAMRCYVASKIGDEVEIPEELIK